VYLSSYAYYFTIEFMTDDEIIRNPIPYGWVGFENVKVCSTNRSCQYLDENILGPRLWDRYVFI
jgi:hypothetical protein